MPFSFLQKEFKETGDLKGNYLFLASIVSGVGNLTGALRKLFPTEIRDATDLFICQNDTFTIEEARSLKERHGTKPISGRGFFIVAATRFTREAQNALLKVLEEPGSHNHFFIITESTEQLLPTVLSRLTLYRLSTENSLPDQRKQADVFLRSSPGERLLFLEKKIKEKGEVLSFLAALEEELRHSNLNEKKKIKALFLAGESRTLLFSPGLSTKHVLERLAILVPLTK